MTPFLGSIYGAAATWRREWYRHHPQLVRRLARPVISVGNLRVGGSGKTPVVEHVARLMLARGERPAVLSRGYGRRGNAPGATLVSDGARVVADVQSAGDEPMMLARSVAGLIVVVAADRYEAGVLAEGRFGATVHILDDGFQHFRLGRDVDLLLVGEEELADSPLPSGRLREPLETARLADALIVDAPDGAAARGTGDRLGVADVFDMHRTMERPSAVPDGARVFAVAGIGRPERFFDDVRAAGYAVAGTMAFRDHHWFDARDIDRIASAAQSAGAAFVFTTRKDAVRLEVTNALPLPVVAIASTTTVHPLAPAVGNDLQVVPFETWLQRRLDAAREGAAVR